MLKVISNTTPIISLLSIDKIDLLKVLYGQIIIPQSVYLEIEQGKHKPYYTDLTQINWIEIKEIKNQDTIVNLGCSL